MKNKTDNYPKAWELEDLTEEKKEAIHADILSIMVNPQTNSIHHMHIKMNIWVVGQTLK